MIIEKSLFKTINIITLNIKIQLWKGVILVSIHDIYRFSQRENRLTALLTFALERQKQISNLFLELSEYPVGEYASFTITLQQREEDSIPDATIYINGKKKL